LLHIKFEKCTISTRPSDVYRPIGMEMIRYDDIVTLVIHRFTDFLYLLACLTE